MNWATKRKLQYLAGFFGFCFLILFIFLYPIIFKKPSCFDGKQNGTEAGVDCGGSCSLMCKQSVSDPFIVWSRAFKIVGNNYNLVAYVENQNKNSAIEKINYEFRVYDSSNRIIGRRQGSTFIPPNKQFAIFEPRFEAGEAVVKSVSFEFSEPFVWTRMEPKIDTLPIYVDNIDMDKNAEIPSLTARVKNESIYNLPKFDVFAILYDKDHNAINVSKTVKNGLNSGENTPVFFTWPESLTSEPVVKDVIVLINPFTFSF